MQLKVILRNLKKRILKKKEKTSIHRIQGKAIKSISKRGKSHPKIHFAPTLSCSPSLKLYYKPEKLEKLNKDIKREMAREGEGDIECPTDFNSTILKWLHLNTYK